ncbi:MAG: hypothetical protein JNK57_09465 [Planctomycetaceae bacterium]|nr:hypothetical protein [Planctomycetaceae bacterium]
MDVISSFFNAVNLPATVLLILVLFYWSLVIFGMLDLGVFDFDWNYETSAPTDGVPDVASASAGFGGALKAVLGFFYLGRVPTMILVSAFALIFWTATVSTNLYLNEAAELSRGLLLWAPIMLGSLLLTKVFFWPFLSFFDEMATNHSELENTLVGKMATVTTSEVTETFGQITIEQQGPPIVLNARAAAMDRFAKGEVVKILSHDSQSNTYLIAAVGGKK